jgi:heat shock protein HslJ
MKQLIILTSLSLALLSCNNTANLSKQTLAGKWLISSINAQRVIIGKVPILTFDNNLSLSGQASCNNISTRYAVDNKTLSIGPIATTRKMCSPELMQQESTLLKVLTKVKRFQIDSGLLIMLDQQGKTVLKAQRVKNKSRID